MKNEDCPINPCFSCAERHKSKQRVQKYIEIWQGNPHENGIVCDPAPTASASNMKAMEYRPKKLEVFAENGVHNMN